MNIYLSDNIKRLRKEKDITQETLADFLGISFQSVSKWERNESLPDITLVPAIANYFGVTIDELMGNDKIINEDKIQKYLDEYDRLFFLNTDESVKQKNALAKEAYKNYPYDWRIINMYRHSLTCGHDGKIEDIRLETRRICEMILDKCTVEEYRSGAVNALLYIVETDEEAEKWLNLLPNEITLWQNENRVDYYARNGRYEEARLQQQKNLNEYYGYVMQVITDICGSWYGAPNPPEQSYIIALKKKQIAITNILFENGEKSWLIGACNETIARAYFKLGDIENGLDYLDEAVQNYIKYDTQPVEFPYTSIGFERMTYKEPERLNEQYSIELFLNDMENDKCYDCVRNNERFKKNIELLKQHKPIKKYFRLEK